MMFALGEAWAVAHLGRRSILDEEIKKTWLISHIYDRPPTNIQLALSNNHNLSRETSDLLPPYKWF